MSPLPQCQASLSLVRRAFPWESPPRSQPEVRLSHWTGGQMDRQGWATSTLGRQAVTVETPLVFASAHAMPFSGSASMMLSISLTFFLLCVCVHMEDKLQQSAHFPPPGSRGSESGCSRLSSKHLYPLNHLSSQLCFHVELLLLQPTWIQSDPNPCAKRHTPTPIHSPNPTLS